MGAEQREGMGAEQAGWPAKCQFPSPGRGRVREGADRGRVREGADCGKGREWWLSRRNEKSNKY